MATARTVIVRVTPRSSKNDMRFEDGVLHVRTTSAPVDGAANAAVVELIARTLGVAKSRVSVVRGLKSRVKTVSVEPFEGPWPWSDSSES